MKAKTYKGKSMRKGGGGAFAKAKDTVAKEYMKKGKSPAEAKRIGSAVAAKMGVEKYGQKEMTKMAVRGKKRAERKSKIDMVNEKAEKMLSKK